MKKKLEELKDMLSKSARDNQYLRHDIDKLKVDIEIWKARANAVRECFIIAVHPDKTVKSDTSTKANNLLASETRTTMGRNDESR